jgi:hypothetical protein
MEHSRHALCSVVAALLHMLERKSGLVRSDKGVFIRGGGSSFFSLSDAFRGFFALAPLLRATTTAFAFIARYLLLIWAMVRPFEACSARKAFQV